MGAQAPGGRGEVAMSCCSSLGPLLSSLGGCRAHLESGPGPGSPLASCSAQCLCGGACLIFISLWAPSCGHPESAALGGCPCWGRRGGSFHGGSHPRPRPEHCGSVEGAGLKLAVPDPRAAAVCEEGGGVPRAAPASPPGSQLSSTLSLRSLGGPHCGWLLNKFLHP